MAFLNKGLTIALRDERETVLGEDEGGVTEVIYMYEQGLVDFVEYINATKEPIHKTVILFEAKGEGIEAEVAMQWKGGNNYAESVYTFANTINTHEGGTHEEGFRDALTRAVNAYAKRRQPAQGGQAGQQGRRRAAVRRRRPRGAHRHRLGEDRPAAVRGPDQDQARQYRGEVVRLRNGLLRV